MPKRPRPNLAVIPPQPPPAGPPPPAGLDAYGAALWNEIVERYEFDCPATYRVLLEACLCAQRAERCRVQIDADGEMLRVGKVVRSHPLLRDEVQNRALCCRLLGKLGLDLEPVKSVGRPPGSVGVSWRDLPGADRTS